MVNKLFIGMIFSLLSYSGFGQSIISYITVNPDEVYIGQPVQLKVSVYTSTWFTKGVNLDNIQVDGALTVYFRSVSNSKDFNGKRYAGVDFYYNLFPTNEGTITVPQIEVNVESPKEGGYKGIKHSIKTKPKSIHVNGVPLGYDANNWLVASSMNVSEKWSSSLNNVKVGDVIQRTISRNAGGTLAEFIPKSQWDSISGVSIYPKRPVINTKKTRTNVSSSRVETVSYLFEKEGKVTLASMEYLYWNSSNKKFYRKQIDSVTINVKPNADLAMLETIKKSLQKEKEVIAQEEIQKPFLIFGISPKKFSKYVIIIVVGCIFLITLLKRLRKHYKVHKIKRLQSERYAFKKVLKTLDKKDFISFLNTVNTWVQKLTKKPITLNEFVLVYGSKELETLILSMNDSHFNQIMPPNATSFRQLIEALKTTRKYFLSQQTSSKKETITNYWLNPTSTD